MKIGYFDLIGGASGDMILGALIDAGVALDALSQDLNEMGLEHWSLDCERVTRSGIVATHVMVHVDEAAPIRTISQLNAIITQSKLPTSIRDDSIKILARLAQVEARIHGTPVEGVHLHELGSMDTIIDIVGAVTARQRLGIERIFCSPFPLARGFVETQHGNFPLPAPATIALIQERNAPVVGVEGNTETVTPTGAAILTTLADGFGAICPMTVRTIGYGAGTRNDPARPNVLRLLIGEAERAEEMETESLMVLETNIDDMNPQFYDHIVARLFERGALDVTLLPMQMKKNRPGTLVQVLCHPDKAADLRATLFAETTTLGVREQFVTRYSLPREIISVETRFGNLRAKIARRPDGQTTIAPEYDDCIRAANAFNVPLRQVWEQVIIDAKKASGH